MRNEIRKDACETSRRKRTHAIGYLDNVLELLERHRVRLVGRVSIKAWNEDVKHASIYSNHIQYICKHFDHRLALDRTSGMVVIDGRSPRQNVGASHSIFTQKFKAGGDAYPRLIEAPAFGNSGNHAELQLADLVCSAFLWPMTMHGYCEGKVSSIHVRDGYWRIGDRYGERIQKLQHRYQNADGRWTGGIAVSDRLGKQSGSRLFRATPPPPSLPAPPSTAALPTTPPADPPEGPGFSGVE